MVASFTLLRFLVCNSLRFFEVHDTWSFYVTASILVLLWTFFIFIWILMSFIGFVCIVANGHWVCNNNKYSFMLHGALNWPSSPPVPKRRRFFSSDAVRCLVLSLFTELLDPVWPNVWPNSILCLMVSAEKPFILWIFKPIETKWFPFSENASKKKKKKANVIAPVTNEDYRIFLFHTTCSLLQKLMKTLDEAAHLWKSFNSVGD